MNTDTSIFDQQGMTRTTPSDRDILKSENTMAIDNQSINADSDFDIKSSPEQDNKEDLLITDILGDYNEVGEGESEMDYASENLSDQNTKEAFTNGEVNTANRTVIEKEKEEEKEITKLKDTAQNSNIDNEIEKDLNYDLKEQSNLDSINTNAYSLNSQKNIDGKENNEEPHETDENEKRAYSIEGLHANSDPIEVYNEEAQLEYESSDDESIGDDDAEKEDKADSNKDGIIVIEDLETGEDKYDIEEEEEHEDGDTDKQTGNDEQVKEQVNEEEDDMFEIIEDEPDQDKFRNDVEDADTDIEITNVNLIEKVEEKEKTSDLGSGGLEIPVYLDLGDDGVYKLFPPTCEEEEDYRELPVAFEDSSVLPIRLESFFASLRQFFRMNSLNLDNDGELVLKFKEIGLCITEDNIYCKDLSILNILSLFEGLRKNTKSKTLIKFMIIDISTHVRFITKFNELSRKLKNGGCLELTQEYIDITDAPEVEAKIEAEVPAPEINDEEDRIEIEQQTPKRKHYDLLSDAEAEGSQEYTKDDASNQVSKRQKASPSKKDEYDLVDIDQSFSATQEKDSEPVISAEYDMLTENSGDEEINDGIQAEENVQEGLVEDDSAENDSISNEFVEDENNVINTEKIDDENDFGLIG
ncbi:hypothetical protein B5S28_g2280 [[Candida] boidinii]|nr:hypothetical protein B5S28_g2280 [[Candida] boidinii]